MWAKDTGLRELRDRAKKMKNEWKRRVVQFEEPVEEAKPDEDCKMEMDGDADSRRKLDLRKKKRSRNRKKNGSKSGGISNRDGVTCCQTTKRLRRCIRSYRACKTNCCNARQSEDI